MKKTFKTFVLSVGVLFLAIESLAAAAPELVSRCVGSIYNPTVFLEWKTKSGADTYSLQRGDDSDNSGSYWRFLNNDQKRFFYEDFDIRIGDTYTYRLKYKPNLTSNISEVTIDEDSCGYEPVQPGELAARCLGGAQNPHVVLEWLDGAGSSNTLQRGQVTSSNRFWNSLSNNPKFTSYSDYNVKLGDTYFYRVRFGTSQTTTTAKAIVSEATCSNRPIAEEHLTGYCEGGANPRVVLVWGQPREDIRDPVNTLQRGQVYPVDNSGGSFWKFMNNDRDEYNYVDTQVRMGRKYRYRVKYSPNIPSNEFNISVNPQTCGCQPGEC